MNKDVKTKKILIVEDELAYSNLLATQLAAKGYKVTEAHDGQLGLDAVRHEKPDLILIDIMMPTMGGMAMLKLLRKQKAGKQIKVILLTNFEPDQKIIGEALRDQPSYYFVKSDVTFQDLLARITELLAA
jgi:DNA-binding response OmpR family regulator